MTPLTIEPVVNVDTVRDEPRMVDRTVMVFVMRELVESVDPTPLVKPMFVVEMVELDRVD
jgi:hypothetical protein